MEDRFGAVTDGAQTPQGFPVPLGVATPEDGRQRPLTNRRAGRVQRRHEDPAGRIVLRPSDQFECCIQPFFHAGSTLRWSRAVLRRPDTNSVLFLSLMPHDHFPYHPLYLAYDSCFCTKLLTGAVARHAAPNRRSVMGLTGRTVKVCPVGPDLKVDGHTIKRRFTARIWGGCR